MSVSNTLTRRRTGVLINYALLLAGLLLSVAGNLYGWSLTIKIGFWLSVGIVVITFVPVHLRSGLWRLVHSRADALDEREIQETLRSLRQAYVVFSILSLLIILTLVVFGLGKGIQLLVVFWVLLYSAHTLPSAFLAWTVSRLPNETEEES
ncbi:MAG TPA: hypothetical protein PLF13_00165 [candidate division Zixibacteria bacterium]|nr:hypothetical protein [candidate division Zixibacteria bacterium]